MSTAPPIIELAKRLSLPTKRSFSGGTSAAAGGAAAPPAAAAQLDFQNILDRAASMLAAEQSRAGQGAARSPAAGTRPAPPAARGGSPGEHRDSSPAHEAALLTHGPLLECAPVPPLASSPDVKLDVMHRLQVSPAQLQCPRGPWGDSQLDSIHRSTTCSCIWTECDVSHGKGIFLISACLTEVLAAAAGGAAAGLPAGRSPPR